MHKKKKKIKKKKLSNLKSKKPLFVRFVIPNGPPMLIEAKHLQRAIDELYKGHKPYSKAAKVITHNLQQVLRHEKMNWTGFILFCETLKITPSAAYKLLGKHFAQEKIAKAKVGFLNEILVKSLLKKMDKWGGVPKAWKNHRFYINSFCRRTGTPLFKSLSNFQDHVTVWKELTIGKRIHKTYNKYTYTKEELEYEKKQLEKLKDPNFWRFGKKL